jgi:hypothetical protein
MRRFLLALTLSLILVVALALPAGAVTNGQPDAGRHPYVGLIIFDDADGPAWRCSGTLLSPTVVLTAGHCTEGSVAARVWFTEVVQGNPEYPFGGATSYEGTAYTYPDFCIECGNGLPGFASNDGGVVVLSEPVPTAVVGTYGALPTAGLVGTLQPKAAVDLVGYGVSVQSRGAPPHVWGGPRVRLFAPTQLVSGQFAHSDLFIRLTANPGGGKGGTCFGDSGGADFLAGTNTILAVNSYVTNSNCAGVTYSQRVDLPEVLAWIRSFL